MTPTCRPARRSTSTARSAGTEPSTNLSSTRVKDTGSWSAITSSTCCGARVHGSTGGFAMKRPMAEDDHRLDQLPSDSCPVSPNLVRATWGRPDSVRHLVCDLRMASTAPGRGSQGSAGQAWGPSRRPEKHPHNRGSATTAGRHPSAISCRPRRAPRSGALSRRSRTTFARADRAAAARRARRRAGDRHRARPGA